MLKSTASARSQRRRRKPRPETLALLSANIKVFRAQHQYSQERLADEAGIHRTYIGDLERCEQNPTLSTLEALADALGIQIGELLLPIQKPSRLRRS